MPTRVYEGPHGFNSLIAAVRKIRMLTPDLNFAIRDSRYIKKMIEQPFQLSDLSFHDGALDLSNGPLLSP